MARIVGGNPMGELRGKLGSNVFSRNKSGQIVRGYAMPTNPSTEAQIRARSAFAQAISGFHTLNAGNKAGWNAFAASYFNSKKRGNVPGIHSGVNAFVSLRNVALNMARCADLDEDNYTIQVNGSVAVTVATPLVPVPQILAPPGPMEAVLGEGKIVINNVIQIGWLPTGAGQLNVNLSVTSTGAGPTPGPFPSAENIFVDGTGQPVGFAVYASNQLVQAGVYVNNPDLVLVGATGLLNGTIAAPATIAEISVVVDSAFVNDSNLGEYKTGYEVDQQAELSLWMYNAQGQIMRLGAKIEVIE
jgi:hypothetical protein